MDLTIPDYAILAVMLGATVVGLFVGFSGALAFLSGLVTSAFAASFAWPLSASYIASVWVRGLAVGVGALLIFGLVRYLVKKFVHGLVAQPGDALLGMLVAALAGFSVMLGIIWGLGMIWPNNPELSSTLLEKVLVRVGQ